MKALLIISSLIFTTIFATTAYTQEATKVINQVHQLYSERFDANGKYIDDSSLTAQFIVSQNAAIKKLRANGNLQKSIRLTNNVMPDLVVNVSIIQEKTGVFAGLLVERSKYDSKNEESFLRLYSIHTLLGGMPVFTLNGSPIVHLKSEQLTTIDGGIITIKYITNYKNNTFDQRSFGVLKANVEGFSFYTTEKEEFREISVNVWFNILSQNFGAKKVSFIR